MRRIIIVDDHPIACMAIRHLLEKYGHIILAEIGNGNDVLSAVNNLKPDMLIIDIDIPGIDGISVINSLRKYNHTLPVLVMSGKNPDYFAVQSARSGANGFLSKKNNLDDLIQAINVISSGYAFFPLRMRDTRFLETDVDESARLQSLSVREFQVLQFLAEGMEIIAIATRMKISNKTVSTYKSRLMEKLSIRTRVELMEFFRRHHLT